MRKIDKAKLRRQRDRAYFQSLGESERLGMGPLSFDNEMARRHGWTDAEIARFWLAITPAYQRISNRMHKRYPERYDLRYPKDPIYIGPDDLGRTLTLGPPP